MVSIVFKQSLSGGVYWDLAGNDIEEIAAVHEKMLARFRPPKPEEDREALLDRFYAAIDPKLQYKAFGLRLLWRCSATAAKWARGKLLEDGRLILKNGYYLKQERIDG